MKDNNLTTDDIEYVCNLVFQAGHLAVTMREGVGIKEKSEPHDLVTEADMAISHMLVKGLNERFENAVIISEEDEDHRRDDLSGRVWLIDPIDGTDNYVKNDGQYCVMVGVLQNLKPAFGWVFGPAREAVYFGGPNVGLWKRLPDGTKQTIHPVNQLPNQDKARLVIGSRDRKNNPWIAEVPEIDFVVSGSIGMKVVKILEDEADIYVHLSSKLKAWDTAGPVSIALAAGMDVGSLDSDQFHFPLPKILHEHSVIIGRPGSLSWSRKHLAPRFVP